MDHGTIPAEITDGGALHDRAVEIAKTLDGMRVADAVTVLELARNCVLRASVTLTKQIPDRPGT